LFHFRYGLIFIFGGFLPFGGFDGRPVEGLDGVLPSRFGFGSGTGLRTFINV
jgi:hypothetical protein